MGTPLRMLVEVTCDRSLNPYAESRKEARCLDVSLDSAPDYAGRTPGMLGNYRTARSNTSERIMSIIGQLSRGERIWEITSSRCYLASYVSRSLPASAGGTLPVADFGSKSAI